MLRMRYIFLAVIAIVVMASCTDNKDRVVKILHTGEKASVEIPAHYVAGDTVVLTLRGAEWYLDHNWMKFEGETYISSYFTKYVKGVIVK